MSEIDSKVVVLDEHREIWSNWWATCLACAHSWIATVQDGTGFVECPECHELRGIKTAPADDR